MAKAPAIMAILGGGLGLATSAIGFFAALVLYAISLGGVTILFIPVVVDGLCAVLGIAGGVISLTRLKIGSALILAGVTIGFAGWMVALIQSLDAGLPIQPLLFLMLIFFVWWAVIILIGGLLAVLSRPSKKSAVKGLLTLNKIIG